MAQDCIKSAPLISMIAQPFKIIKKFDWGDYWNDKYLELMTDLNLVKISINNEGILTMREPSFFYLSDNQLIN